MKPIEILKSELSRLEFSKNSMIKSFVKEDTDYTEEIEEITVLINEYKGAIVLLYKLNRTKPAKGYYERILYGILILLGLIFIMGCGIFKPDPNYKPTFDKPDIEDVGKDIDKHF